MRINYDKRKSLRIDIEKIDANGLVHFQYQQRKYKMPKLLIKQDLKPNTPNADVSIPTWFLRMIKICTIDEI